MIIDARDLVLGRIGTRAAKAALLGNEVAILNCENAIITGDRKKIIEHYKQRRERGIPAKGPFIHRDPEKLVKRSIRGMLPYKQPKGRDAFSRIKCYMGIPEKFKDKKAERFEEAHISRLPNTKFMHIKDLCKTLGAKI